jgi:hypothetical protein
MPTATVGTPQTKDALTTLAISCFGWGGKYWTGFQAFQELVMAKYVDGISADESPGKRRARKQSNAAKAATIAPLTEENITAPGRRRGRGRPPKGAGNQARASKPMSSDNEAILKCIAAGYSTPQAIIAELQKAYGITKRPNHLGMALRRLKDAGKLVTDGTAWVITPLTRAAA